MALKQVPNPQPPLTPVSDKEVSLILAFRPRIRNEFRAWVLVKFLLDTGLRIDEVLTAQVAHLDMDDCQLRVRGKGSKERIVPFSLEARKDLFRYRQRVDKLAIKSPFVFCTKNGTGLTYRNAYREIKLVCKKAGVEGEHIHPHLPTQVRRHLLPTGAVTSTASRILGHASLSTTQIYLRSMGVEALQENHSALTPLARV